MLCTGSRAWTEEGPVAFELDRLQRSQMFEDPITIVHGACPKGADAVVDKVARLLGYAVEKHPADWSLNGKSAGFIRNEYMVRQGADLCFAFWDGKSNGTRDCLTRAVVAGIPVRIVPMPVKR